MRTLNDSRQAMNETLKPLSKVSIVGYGAGDAANNLAFTTATMFLLLYYTDVAGISAAAAGTLLLVVRIFDAFSDLFAGRMVDKTYSRKFGKFRPFNNVRLGSSAAVERGQLFHSADRPDGYAALGLRQLHVAGAGVQHG
ncbi:MFS transporter [Paenarthrobacter sp. Z7-10]|uniref:MFS transporter n=1 Tax=Paenarthrobacter sp. Z7-10 TaxID=2787635 RepID=UPI0022A994D0|nr:MFS transporter [Paenarthrobacter sp. Z7-10]